MGLAVLVSLNPGVASGVALLLVPYSPQAAYTDFVIHSGLQRPIRRISNETRHISAVAAGTKIKYISFLSGPSRLTADFASERCGVLEVHTYIHVHTIRFIHVHKVWISHSSGISLNRLSADLSPVQRSLAVLWLWLWLWGRGRKGCCAIERDIHT